MADSYTIQIPGGTEVEIPGGTPPEEIKRIVGGYLKKTMTPEQIDAIPTATRLTFGLGQGAVAAQARKNLANTMGAQTAADYEQDIRNAGTRFTGTMVGAIPAVVAAPFTGGASVPAAMAIMGGAGLAGGLARESVKAVGGSSEMPSSGADLAKTLSLDAIMGAAGEGAARGIGYATTSLAPKLLERAASKFTAGKDLLEKTFVDTRAQLYNEIRAAGRPRIDVGNTLANLYDRLAHLPRGAGKFGHRFSDLTDKAANVIRTLEEDMVTGGGSVAAQQPLDSLVRIKGSLQQMAWKDSGLAAEERQVFKQAAIELDGAIRAGLKKVGGNAPALYERSLQLMKTQKQHDVGVSLAEAFLKRATGRAISGALLGGTAGYAQDHSLTKTLEGAAIGAAGTTALSTTVSKAVPLALEMVMSHPQAAALFKKALIQGAVEGTHGPAALMAARAFTMAGVRERAKEWMAPALGARRVGAGQPASLGQPPDAAGPKLP